MSEVQTPALPPVPETSVAAYNKMSSDTQVVAHGQLKAAGFDVSKLSVGIVTAPAVVVPGAATDKPRPDQAKIDQWKFFQKNSSLAPELIIKTALENGVDLIAEKATADTAPIIAAQKHQEALAKALEPPETSHGYKIDYGRYAQQADNIEDMHAKLTAGYLSAGLPANLAEPLTLALLESEATFENKLEENASQEDIERQQVAFKTRMIEEGSKVRNLSGWEEIRRLSDLAETVLPPAMLKELYETKSLHTAAVRVQLAAFGKVLEARKK
jgi:hypothetical protein